MCPFLVHLLGGRARLRRVLLYGGTAIVFAASLGAAFSYTPTQLIMTQGVLYGVGSGLIFAPNMSLMDEWFIKRRSFAYGIYFASSSIAAAIIPPVLRVLLQNYSSKATLVGWSIFVGVVLNIALLGLRPRLPKATTEMQEKINPLSGNVSYRFLKSPLFWLMMFSNVLQASSQYLPSVYIPSYATEVARTSPQAAAALLTIYNIASAICQPFIGILADRRGVLWPLLLCTLIPAVAVLCVWGFAKSYGLMALTCILFGGLSGGYVVLRNRFATAVVGSNEYPNEELVVSAMIMFIRGCATIASGFVGVAVSNAGATIPLDEKSYGASTWVPLLLTVGILSGISSIGGLGFIGKRRHNGLYVSGNEKQR